MFSYLLYDMFKFKNISAPLLVIFLSFSLVIVHLFVKYCHILNDIKELFRCRPMRITRLQTAQHFLCVSASAFVGIAAIGLINEALDEGDPTKTLSMLQSPSAKLTDVDPSIAQHYHDKLLEARREKAHVRTSCS